MNSRSTPHDRCQQLLTKTTVGQRCWWCFDTRPRITTNDGDFCGWPCAKAMILDRRRPGFSQDLVRLHHEALTHEDIVNIPIAPPRNVLSVFGGSLTHAQFRNLLGVPRMWNLHNHLYISSDDSSVAIYKTVPQNVDTMESDSVRKSTSWNPSWDDATHESTTLKVPTKESTKTRIKTSTKGPTKNPTKESTKTKGTHAPTRVATARKKSHPLKEFMTS